MPVDVYGELLAERELHDGLAFTAPEEGRGLRSMEATRLISARNIARFW
jgi:hypothetical protein